MVQRSTQTGRVLELAKEEAAGFGHRYWAPST
jgi:hypothetical protein